MNLEKFWLELAENMKLEKADHKHGMVHYYFRFRDIPKCVMLSKPRFCHRESLYSIAWNIAQMWYTQLGKEQGWVE